MKKQERNLADYIELSKEKHRYHFEYFKQLSTLSTASIGAILVLFTRIPPSSLFWRIFTGLSLACLIVCLGVTLFAMTASGNLAKKLVDLQTLPDEQQGTKEREIEIDRYIDEYGKGMKELMAYDYVTRYTFLVGVSLFLIYALINILAS